MGEARSVWVLVTSHAPRKPLDGAEVLEGADDVAEVGLGAAGGSGGGGSGLRQGAEVPGGDVGQGVQGGALGGREPYRLADLRRRDSCDGECELGRIGF